MPEQITMQEYVESRGITRDVLADFGLSKDEDGWEHNRYTIRLKYNERILVTPWRQGLGIVGPPDAASVLNSLVSDASSFTGARSFEEWAMDFGYDTDSRAAEKIYEAVGKVARDLEAWLGGDELLFLTDHVERM